MNTGSELVSMPSMKTAGGWWGSLKYTVFGSVCVCVYMFLYFYRSENYTVLDPHNENVANKNRDKIGLGFGQV